MAGLELLSEAVHERSEQEHARGSTTKRASPKPSRPLEVVRDAQLERIEPHSATFQTSGGARTIEVDRVFILIGSDLPVELLAATGVRVQTHRGTAPVVVAALFCNGHT